MSTLSRPVLIGVLALIVGLVIWLHVLARRRLRQSTWGALFWWTGAVSGKAFGYLLYYSVQRAVGMHSNRSIPYKPRDEMIQYAALSTGIVFLFVVLSALLPLVLDALEKRGFASFVGARHVRATKSGFLTVISGLSILGVGVSSCALCSVTSIMGGFGHDLKRKILGNNAHIVIDVTRPGGFADWPDRLESVRAALAEAGGGAATPVVGGEAMGSSASNTAGALVRGIDPATIGDVIDLPKNIEVGKFAYLLEPEKLASLPADEVIGRGPTGEPYLKGPDFRWSPDSDPSIKDYLKQSTRTYPGVIIGRELAKSLHVLIGDEVTLLSPLGELGPTGVMPRSRKFRVAAIFYSGMYEYDATHAYILKSEAQKFFSLADDDRVTNIDVRVAQPEQIKEIRQKIEAAARAVPFKNKHGAELRVRDWMEMNKNLFSALLLERIATFVILSIAIAVASFCIVCTLLLMVTEKGKEIAILKALGASDGAIQRIFMIEGIVIGGIGTIFGVCLALAACTGLRWFGVRLDPEVYYIDRLPVNVDLRDYTLVGIAAFVICTLATIYPARAASKLPPVDGLRWE